METPLDHFFNDRIDPENFDALTRGPLAEHLKAYAQQLYNQGYAVQTVQLQLRMLGNFNRWLQSNCLVADEIDSSTVERYRRFRIKAGKLRTGSFEVILPFVVNASDLLLTDRAIVAQALRRIVFLRPPSSP